jgi:hypothetical protein
MRRQYPGLGPVEPEMGFGFGMANLLSLNIGPAAGNTK